MVRRTVRGHGSGVLTDDLYRIECTMMVSTSLEDEYNHGSTVTEQNASPPLIHEFICNDVQMEDVNSCG